MPPGVRRGLCPAPDLCPVGSGYAPGSGLALFALKTANASSAKRSLMQMARGEARTKGIVPITMDRTAGQSPRLTPGGIAEAELELYFSGKRKA
jgi:hypothetical protein